MIKKNMRWGKSMENDEHMLYTWFLISFKPKKKWEKKKNVTCPVPFFDDPWFWAKC